MVLGTRKNVRQAPKRDAPIEAVHTARFRRGGGSGTFAVFLLALHWFGIAGCATRDMRSLQGPIGVDRSASASLVEKVAQRNDRLNEVIYYREAEWPLHRTPKQPPELGLALSGGGIRSASFSVGVLTGLYEQAVFPHRTDLVSAVSGGGYALTWLYGRRVGAGVSMHDLLAITPDAQAPAGDRSWVNAEQAELAGRTDLIKVMRPIPLGVVVSNVVFGIPYNIVANGAFGFKSNTTALRRYYERRLRRMTEGNGQRVSWAGIADALHEPNNLASERLPLPILNATLDLGLGASDAEQTSYGPLFEFGPLRFGTTGIGYYCTAGHGAPCTTYPRRTEMGGFVRASAVSGAAVDTAFLDPIGGGQVETFVASALNIDLGMWFKNPSADRKASLCWLKAVPGSPIFLRGKWYRDKGKSACRIKLTDGGHFENLGAFSLVRRLPHKLIIVDGESDAGYDFPGYHRLKSLLLTDMNLRISIPDIDHSLQDGPIFEGKVYGAVDPEDGRLRTVDILYLKIPDRKFVEQYCHGGSLPASVCDYASTAPRFPFDRTTGDQYYDPRQFEAYRDLGLYVTRQARTKLAALLDFAQNGGEN